MPVKQPAIPDPTPDTNSLTHTARALKEGMELLTGNNPANKLRAAVTWQDLISLGMVSPALQSLLSSALVEGDVPLGSEVSLTNVVTANVTSIFLAPGTWDISGVVLFKPAATTNTTAVSASITTTSATNDTTNGRFTTYNFGTGGVVTGGSRFTCVVVPCRFNLLAATTVYLAAFAAFTVSTMGAAGHIRALKVE